MSDFRYVVDIKVSPQRIWAALLDVQHWPEWTTSVSRVQRMDIGPLTLGSRTRIWQPGLMSAVWQVTSLDERRHIFAWTSRTLGIKIVARHQIDSLGTSSRVTLTLHYAGAFGAVMARIYRDRTWDYLAREGTGLRKRCETAIPARPAAAVPIVRSSKFSDHSA